MPSRGIGVRPYGRRFRRVRRNAPAATTAATATIPAQNHQGALETELDAEGPGPAPDPTTTVTDAWADPPTESFAHTSTVNVPDFAKACWGAGNVLPPPSPNLQAKLNDPVPPVAFA